MIPRRHFVLCCLRGLRLLLHLFVLSLSAVVLPLRPLLRLLSRRRVLLLIGLRVVLCVLLPIVYVLLYISSHLVDSLPVAFFSVCVCALKLKQSV